MNSKLKMFLEELTIEDLRNDAVMVPLFLPLLEDRFLSAEDCLVIWGLSKRDSDLEFYSRVRFPYASLQDCSLVEIELAKQVKFNSKPITTTAFSLETQKWIDDLLINDVPNHLSGTIREKCQIYLHI